MIKITKRRFKDRVVYREIELCGHVYTLDRSGEETTRTLERK